MQLKLVSQFSRIPPEAIVLLSFASVIIAGTILLSLPISHNDSVGFLDALFTSTSAVCVTGLIVVDTGKDFTPFGQMIILLLIQLGGLGIMTFAALAFDLLGKRLSINSQEAMTRELVHMELATVLRRQFKKMLFLVLTIEGIGAIILLVGMLPSDDIAFTLWSAIFHSVSAFCNAGFSLYSDNIIRFKDNLIIVYTIAILISFCSKLTKRHTT